MFRTSKCSSSGRLVHAVLLCFIHPCKQSVRWQDVPSTRMLHGCVKEIHKTACTILPEDEHLDVRNISKTL